MATAMATAPTTVFLPVLAAAAAVAVVVVVAIIPT